jgi:hypothetical protein
MPTTTAGRQALEERLTGMANRALDKASQAFDDDSAEDASEWLNVAGSALAWIEPPTEPREPQPINVTLTMKEDGA